MRQMGANTVIETRTSRLIQMGTNADTLNGKFAPAAQLGANDISTPQPNFRSNQEQKPVRIDYEENCRQQQMQQIQL